jgi:hypothetical protein
MTWKTVGYDSDSAPIRNQMDALPFNSIQNMAARSLFDGDAQSIQ